MPTNVIGNTPTKSPAQEAITVVYPQALVSPFIATPDHRTTDIDPSQKQLVDVEIPYVILGKLIVYGN